MAISKKITTTDTTLTIKLSGFSELKGTRMFYFYIEGKEYDDYQVLYMPGGDTSIECKFTNLTPGTKYTVGAEMTAPAGTTFDYGPYTEYTTGNSPWVVTGYPEIWFVGGDYIYVKFADLNTVSEDRQVVIGHRKTGEKLYAYESGGTIPANSTNKTPYFRIKGLEEKTDYDISVEIMYNGGTIDAWELQTATGYAEGGSLAVSNITESGCTLAVSGIPATSKYPRTLTWYGQEGTDGEWEELTTTMATSTAMQTYSLNKLLPATYYGFKVSVSAGGEFIEELTASGTTATASGNLAATDMTEYSAKLTLSGLATGVSFVRKVKWYYKAASDSAYKQYDVVSTVAQSASSVAVTIDTLASSTAYSFKAEICDINETVLGSKTATGYTTETAASISSGSVTSASVKVTVSDLTPVSYERTFEWLYKRENEVDFVKFDETKLSPSENADSVYKVFKPLIASTRYVFKVYIKKDGMVMKELSVTVRTSLDNSMVPDAEIYRIEQPIGDTAVKVFWDAPEHDTGVKYKLQYSADGEEYTDAGGVITVPPADGYTEITLPALGTSYHIQVMSYYELDGEVATKFSEPVPVYMFEVFEWETAKVTGQPFSLTSTEWNLAVHTARERIQREDVIVEEYYMEEAVPGRLVTATQFNQLLRTVNVFNPHNISNVNRGDAITADMLNLLAAKLNLE